MDRTVYIEIGTKLYPMRFSLGAAKRITEKFGSLDKMQKSMDDEDKAMETIIWIVDLLVRQGCAYKNLFEPDTPVEKNAPVEEGKYVPATVEEIEVGIDLVNMRAVMEKIFQTMGKGKEMEIEIEEKGNRKNVKTT